VLWDCTIPVSWSW
jgi:Type IV secretory pathway, VirD4 components